MKIDKTTKMSILYDYYGQLLTDKQRQVFTYYYDDNLSLSEIGDELSVSKQGIHDALKKAEAMLLKCEEKLGLVTNNQKKEEIFSDTESIIKRLSVNNKADKEIKKEISKIEENIKKLRI